MVEIKQVADALFAIIILLLFLPILSTLAGISPAVPAFGVSIDLIVVLVRFVVGAFIVAVLLAVVANIIEGLA
jgi:hypothetical protein